MAVNSITAFSAGQLGDANKVNDNFDTFEGTLLPIRISTSAGSFNIGSATQQWRTGYFQTSVIFSDLGNTTTVSGVDNSTMDITGGAVGIKAGGIRGSTANSGGSSREVTGTISTPDIRPGAFTHNTTSASGSQATGTTITSIAVTANSGATILLMAYATLGITVGGTTGTYNVDISVDRGGTALTGGKANYTFAHPGSHNDLPSLRVTLLDAPVAGSYTYNFRYTNNSTFTITVDSYAFQIAELKK